MALTFEPSLLVGHVLLKNRSEIFSAPPAGPAQAPSQLDDFIGRGRPALRQVGDAAARMRRLAVALESAIVGLSVATPLLTPAREYH